MNVNNIENGLKIRGHRATFIIFKNERFLKRTVLIDLDILEQRRRLYNRKSQCLANPNVQPNFSCEKYGKVMCETFVKKIVY
jgi:hypothetical protein